MDNQRKVIISYDEYEKLKQKAAKKQVDYVLTIRDGTIRDFILRIQTGVFVSEKEVIAQAVNKCNEEVESIRQAYKVKVEKMAEEITKMRKENKKQKLCAKVLLVLLVVLSGCYWYAKYKGMI
jgi:hypothetical protein